MEYENPFLETQAMISECAELNYEKCHRQVLLKFMNKVKIVKIDILLAHMAHIF